MPIFFGLVSGYWVCYQFFSLPLLLGQIRAGLWNLPKVPGARPGGQNAHFFWFGFWLLGLLPVFQPPIKAGANSGWALKFAKVPGARPGGQNAPRTPGAPGAPWLPGAPRTPWSQDTNSPRTPEAPRSTQDPNTPGYWFAYQVFNLPLKWGRIWAGLCDSPRNTQSLPWSEERFLFFDGLLATHVLLGFQCPNTTGANLGFFFETP